MNIRFLRVMGTRSGTPRVLAIADEHPVRWAPNSGWSCTCDELSFPTCPHIPAVEALIDPRVTEKEPTP